MQKEMAAGSLGKTDVVDWSARVYGKQKFAGAGKTNTGWLVPLERRLAKFVLPRVPRWLETYHLTLLTPVWALLIVVSSYLAARDLRWMWMVNLVIWSHRTAHRADHNQRLAGQIWDPGVDGRLAVGGRMWHCSSSPPGLSGSKKALAKRYAGQAG